MCTFCQVNTQGSKNRRNSYSLGITESGRDGVEVKRREGEEGGGRNGEGETIPFTANVHTDEKIQILNLLHTHVHACQKTFIHKVCIIPSRMVVLGHAITSVHLTP